MNWKSKWMETKNKSKIGAWILVLMMMASLMNLLPAWAAKMDADPDTVTEQEGFDQQFTLTLTEDTFQSSVSSEHVELGGDFQSLSVTDTVYSDSTKVTTRVYGDLFCDYGTGTIKIYGDALVGGSDITAEITVDSTGSTGGSGTAEDPYHISEASQLNMVRHDLNAHYKLVNDIDLGVEPYNQGQGWEPIIGTIGGPFNGGFDGNGYTIRNLYINRSDTDSVGLFGATSQYSVIKDVRLEDLNVTGNNNVGGLVGYKTRGTIENSHVTGVVKGNAKVGGLVGENYEGTIQNSYATADVEGSRYVGGLVGNTISDTIANSYATGNVKGNNHVGGLVGFNDQSQITNSYATANVTSTGSAGGLVGGLLRATITNSYATGTVEGVDYVGGLVGKVFNVGNSIIENSHATGTVNGNNYVGGLVGENYGTINNSFYNRQTTSQDKGVGSGTVAGVTGLTTTQMKQQNSLDGWNFTTPVWQIDENITYPYLAWQNDNQDFAPPVFADGYPQAGNVTHNGLDLMVQVDEDATAYYVVLLEGTDTSAGDYTPVQNGSFELTGGTDEIEAITGLDPETTYDIYVGTEDMAGNPQPDVLTAMVQVTTTSAPDTTPPDVTDKTISTSGLTDTGVTLSWNKATDNVSDQSALQYLVYRSDTGKIDTIENMEANGTAEGTYAADTDIKEITGLTGDTTYYFNIIVKDEADNKTAYTMKEVTTQAALLPVMGGTVTISGEAKYGETLTADISGITYDPAIKEDEPSYQWKRGEIEIARATASTYSLVEADISENITVIVAADGIHATGSVTSVATAAVAKADGPEAPAAPVLESKTHNIVTLGANAAYEYRVDEGVWQDSNMFTGLSPQTEFTFTTRVKETATHEASAESDGLSVTTEEEPAEPDTTPPDVTDKTISTSGLTDTGVTLSWNKATDNVSEQSALQYLVYRSDTGNIDTIENMEANGTAEGTYATDADIKEITGLTGDTTYYFNIIVKDEADNKTAYTMKEVTTSAKRRSGGGGGSGGSTGSKNSASKFIKNDEGGSVSFGNATIEVPAGTLPDDATFKVKRLIQRETEDLILSGLQVKIGSDVYEITTTGDRDFGDNTVTIKIAYDPDKIGNSEEPVIHYYNEETEEWTSLETTVEQGGDGKWYAVVEVNHLTKFTVFSVEVEEKETVVPEQKVIVLNLDKKMVTVNGSPYTLDAPPYIDTAANRTLVPIRFVSEALKTSVDWNAETRQVTIKDGDKEIVLIIGSSDVLVNREKQTIDCTPAVLPPGRTFVPLRFVSETLGTQVDWKPTTGEITITR